MNKNTNIVHLASKTVGFIGATSLTCEVYTPSSQFRIYEITQQSMSLMHFLLFVKLETKSRLHASISEKRTLQYIKTSKV